MIIFASHLLYMGEALCLAWKSD